MNRSSMRPSTNLVIGWALCVILAVALTGCAPSGLTVQSAGNTGQDPVPYHGPVPSFSGPWAIEFAQAYRSTTSKLDHQILGTGKITEQGYAAVGRVFVSCMAAHGYRVTLGSMIDTFSIHSPGLTKAQLDAQRKALLACQRPFDAVGVVYLQMRQNPQNKDLDLLVSQCLVRRKIAPADYTEAQYKADLETQMFPFNIDSPKADSCLVSPLGLSVSQP